MPRLSIRRAALLAALVAFLVFAPTLDYPLVWDDVPLTWRAASPPGGGGLAAVLTQEFQLERGVPTGYYRPVVMLSLWLDGKLASAITVQYHLTNVLLHAACTFLVVLLLGRLIPAGGTGPLLAGALFALHPVHTEAVAFVSGRTDLLAALFVLSAALFWLDHRGRPSLSRLVASGLCLLFGLMSKEVAAMLPVVLLAIDAATERGGGASWWARNRAPLVAWSAALALAAALRFGVAGVALGAAAGEVPTFATRLAAFATFLRLLVVPWPLNAYYTVESLPPLAPSLVVALLLVAAFVVAARVAGRASVLGGAAFVVAFLVPVMGFVPIRGAAVAERFLYLPSVGVALLAAGLLSAASRRPAVHRAALVAVLVVGAVFAAGTITRSRTWSSAETLGREIERTSPAQRAGTRNEFARKLQARGMHAQAAAALREAVALQPGAAVLWNNLGVSQLALGQAADALASFDRALALDPSLAEARLQRGMALIALGRRDEAAVEADRLAPGDEQRAHALRDALAR